MYVAEDIACCLSRCECMVSADLLKLTVNPLLARFLAYKHFTTSSSKLLLTIHDDER